MVSLLLISIIIKFLDKENYGVWLTLSSIIGWLGFFDIGLGNGLRNKLSISLANNDREKGMQYVSTAYASLAIIMGSLFLLFVIINSFLNWQKILNTNIVSESILTRCALLVFFSFGLKFVLDLISVIVTASQRSALAGLINFLTNVTVLLLTFVLTKLSQPSLFNFVALTTLSPIAVLLLANFFLFYKDSMYSSLRPKVSHIRSYLVKDLFGLGLQFFVIQVMVIIIFSTHNIMISQIFSPAEVTPYNIAFRYFSVVTMVFSIILTPYWPAFTEAHVRHDNQWISGSVRKLIYVWLLSVLGTVIMLVFSREVYRLWLGPEVTVPFSVSAGMAIFVTISNWNSIFATYINSISKIRLQLFNSILTGIVTIPLSYYLSKYTSLGLSGIIIGTSICLLFGSVWAPIQYRKLITNKAKGIWNK